MKENTISEETTTISNKTELKQENSLNTINISQNTKKKRKKSSFNIPIIQINIKYYEKKIQQRNKNKKKEKSSNFHNIFPIINNQNIINKNLNINNKFEIKL